MPCTIFRINNIFTVF